MTPLDLVLWVGAIALAVVMSAVAVLIVAGVAVEIRKNLLRR